MAWQATGGNLKGPKGDNGADGAKGDAGKSLHVANITVSDNSDVSVAALSPATPIATGDLISDVDGRLFTVSSVVNGDTVHVSNQIAGVTFKGPKGDKGEDGKPGADGKDGTGVNIKGSYDSPDALKQEHPTGASGDAYLVAGALYVWSGSEWTNVGSIQGPQGPKGADGTNGQDGRPGKDGTNGLGWTWGHGFPSGSQPVGSLYLDLDSGDVYSYTQD